MMTSRMWVMALAFVALVNLASAQDNSIDLAVVDRSREAVDNMREMNQQLAKIDFSFFNMKPMANYLKLCPDCYERVSSNMCPFQESALDLKKWAMELETLLSHGCSGPGGCKDGSTCCLRNIAPLEPMVIRMTQMLEDMYYIVQGNCDSCRVGTWSMWGSWSQCEKNCGRELVSRTRFCITLNNPNLEPCMGPDIEFKNETCGPEARHGNFSEWSSWSSCSATCGNATKTRSRSCDSPAPNDCGKDCCGGKFEQAQCDGLPECDPCIDGMWSSWGTWGSCSVTCGSGIQERTRECNNPSPNFCGKPCPGFAIDVRPCDNQACPQFDACIDGNWGEWGNWEQCSTTCDAGTRKRTRDCNNPEANYCGLPCPGIDRQIEDCNNQPCEKKEIVCESPADIVFLLDSSGSINSRDRTNYQRQKDFVKNFVRPLEIGPDGVQVGITIFSNIVENQFTLNAHTDKAGLIDAIEEVRYLGSYTETGMGIKYAMEKDFTATNGSRPGVVDVLIVITDGQATDKERPHIKEQLVELRKTDILTFAIGVTKNVDQDELVAIAGDADQVFSADDFSALKEILKDVLKTTCRVVTSKVSARRVGGGSGNAQGGSGNQQGGSGNQQGGSGNQQGGSGNQQGGSGNRQGGSGNAQGGGNDNMIPMDPVTARPTTKKPRYRYNANCLRSCDGKEPGKYPSCRGCSIYSDCSESGELRERRCKSGKEFDVNLRECVAFSSSCINLY